MLKLKTGSFCLCFISQYIFLSFFCKASLYFFVLSVSAGVYFKLLWSGSLVIFFFFVLFCFLFSHHLSFLFISQYGSLKGCYSFFNASSSQSILWVICLFCRNMFLRLFHQKDNCLREAKFHTNNVIHFNIWKGKNQKPVKWKKRCPYYLNVIKTHSRLVLNLNIKLLGC